MTRFFRSTNRRPRTAANRSPRRRLAVEQLETRALLSTTPVAAPLRLAEPVLTSVSTQTTSFVFNIVSPQGSVASFTINITIVTTTLSLPTASSPGGVGSTPGSTPGGHTGGDAGNDGSSAQPQRVVLQPPTFAISPFVLLSLVRNNNVPVNNAEPINPVPLRQTPPPSLSSVGVTRINLLLSEAREEIDVFEDVPNCTDEPPPAEVQVAPQATEPVRPSRHDDVALPAAFDAVFLADPLTEVAPAVTLGPEHAVDAPLLVEERSEMSVALAGTAALVGGAWFAPMRNTEERRRVQLRPRPLV